MGRHGGDPRWITTRFASRCDGCGRTIPARERAYYYPVGSAIYCGAKDCGQARAERFASEAADEAAYGGHGNPYVG